jgi:RNA polymerase sigma-70 factor (ECF subfamily)
MSAPTDDGAADGADPDFLTQLRRGAVDSQTLGKVWDHYRGRLRRLVRLRMDRRLQGRIDPSDVLQEAFVDFQSRVEEYVKPRGEASTGH